MDALSIDEQLAVLRDAFPRWQIWTVRVTDGLIPDLQWCAKRCDAPVWRHAWEARHLAEYLRELEAEPSGFF